MINKYTMLFLFSVLIASFSQTLLKKSADRIYKNKINKYLNAYVLSAYSLFFLSTILTVLSLKGIPLSRAVVLESVGYFYIIILSRIMLKEKITAKRILGNLVIVTGIIVFNYNPNI